MSRLLSRSAATLLILGVTLLCTMLALKSSEASPTVAASAPTALQTDVASHWEYKSMSAKTSDALLAQANQAGTESWELVNVVHTTSSNLPWVGFFKRLQR